MTQSRNSRTLAVRVVLLSLFAAVLTASGEAHAACPYSSIQARVQFNINTPWEPSIALTAGQTFNVASLKNGFGQLTDPGTTTLSVQAPNGIIIYPSSNPATITASLTGNYLVSANCQGLSSNVATVSVSSNPTTYDMLDYMKHDDPNTTNVLMTNLGQEQHFRTYEFAPNRFFITKNYNSGIGAADEYEEFYYDSTYIYLVRDTSWQPENWCTPGVQTQFELWHNGVNRGAWIPRLVQSGNTYTTGPFEVKARYEGGTCQVCDSPTDSNGNTSVTRTVKVTHYATAPFNSLITDVIDLHVIDGPGLGEHYYFSKTMGWVGYTDPTPQTSYWHHYANPFQLTIRDSCPIKNPGMEMNSTVQFGSIAHFGPNGGWAPHAEFQKDNRGSLEERFGFYAAGTTEQVHQRLDMRYEANKTYTFQSWAQGGLDDVGVLPYELGYANVDNDSNSFVLLSRTARTVGKVWAQTAGVSYTTGTGLPVGKQIMIRFGPNGSSDIWFDNLTLTVTP